MNRNIFPVNSSLLNPKFDGYKLHAMEPESALRSYDLPEPGATQSTVSNRSTHLSFEEMQSRVRHNHLSPGGTEGTVAYIDKNGMVTVVTFDQESMSSPPNITHFYEIPRSIFSEASISNPPKEYPAALSLDRNTWVITDGLGRLDIVRSQSLYNSDVPGRPVASFEFVNANGVAAPFHLHSAAYLSNYELYGTTLSVIAVISHRVVIPQASGPTAFASTRATQPLLKTEFDVIALELDFPISSTRGGNIPIRSPSVLWRRRGSDIPLAVSIFPDARRVLLLGGSPYSKHGEVPETDSVPSADEMAPIPRPNENLDATNPTGSSISLEVTPPPPPPYSWHQTSDSVTVAFPLPASTSPSSIKVTIGPKDLTLLVHQRPDAESHAIPIPRYLKKAFWADVDASSSIWTWDKEGDRQNSSGSSLPQNELTMGIGLLTLHLEKKHEGTKWSHLFKSVGTGSTDPTDTEVLETVDPSELWLVRESLEKYTAALAAGEDASGLGLGKGMPSLGQGEFDEELDSDSGAGICMTWVEAHTGNDCIPPGEQKKYGVSPGQLLSRPLPLCGMEENMNASSLVVKHDVDGLLFEVPEQQDVDGLLFGVPKQQDDQPHSIASWRHTATYSALSFVLASKRDTKFVYHISSKVALAFESGRGRGMGDAGGNVYLYRGAEKKSRWAQQAVLKIGGEKAGALLGACGVVGSDGRTYVVCLCEKQITVIAGAEG